MPRSKKQKRAPKQKKQIKAKIVELAKEAKKVKDNGRPDSVPNTFELAKIYGLCLLGLSDTEIAIYCTVDITTFQRWCVDWPKLAGVLREGREDADAEIAKSIFRRGNGYSHSEDVIKTVSGTVRTDKNVKIIATSGRATVVAIKTTKNYPPDTQAGMYWLNNRQRDRWKNKIDDDTPVQLPSGPVNINVVTDQETINRLINADRKGNTDDSETKP